MESILETLENCSLCQTLSGQDRARKADTSRRTEPPLHYEWNKGGCLLLMSSSSECESTF
jgi:hypothetical protein